MNANTPRPNLALARIDECQFLPRWRSTLQAAYVYRRCVLSRGRKTEHRIAHGVDVPKKTPGSYSSAAHPGITNPSGIA